VGARCLFKELTIQVRKTINPISQLDHKDHDKIRKIRIPEKITVGRICGAIEKV